MRHRYGYYVLLPDGSATLSGEDWGPSTNTYKVGQNLGARDGRERRIVAVEKGADAIEAGFSVLVLIEELPPGRVPQPASRSTAFLRGIAKLLAKQEQEKKR